MAYSLVPVRYLHSTCCLPSFNLHIHSLTAFLTRPSLCHSFYNKFKFFMDPFNFIQDLQFALFQFPVNPLFFLTTTSVQKSICPQTDSVSSLTSLALLSKTAQSFFSNAFVICRMSHLFHLFVIFLCLFTQDILGKGESDCGQPCSN